MARSKARSLSEKEEYAVECISGKRVRRGKTEYYVKWKGYPESDNSWVLTDDLYCPKLVTKFEREQEAQKKKVKARTPTKYDMKKKKHDNLKNADSKTRVKESLKKKVTDHVEKKLLTIKKGTVVRRLKLKPMKIVRATKVNGEVKFVVAYGANTTYMVSSKEAKLKCPQLVIDFYEEKLTWLVD